MKTILRTLAVVAACAAATTTFAAQAVIGQPAPEFTLTDMDGNTHSLSDFRGKTVVLEWVNPECPFVVKHYSSGNIPEMQKSATDDGVVWLLINSGKDGAQGVYAPAKAKQWMEKNDAAPTAYLNDRSGDVGRSYGAKTTPHMFVITADGTLVYDGAIDSIPSAKKDDLARAENYVKAALTAVKAGERPERSKTNPYGCSVKY